jgi:hypothetical protein
VEPDRYSEELTMAAELAVLSTVTRLTTASLLVSAVAMALGVFIVVPPDQAAKIWGAKRLENLTVNRRPQLVHWYRLFGIFLFLGGLLVVIEDVIFSQ